MPSSKHGSPGQAQRKALHASAADYQSYFEACQRAFRFSGALLVAQDGNEVWSAACGMASLELDVPNTMTTKFRIASITKQITAMAIVILHEQGKLELSQSITKYVKHAPRHWKKITVHHLLTNTSGIPSFTSFPDHNAISRYPRTPEETLELFRDKELNFAPGEKYEYNNSGYVLLGIIIENVSGMSYGDFLRTHIFEPLGMHDSGVDEDDRVLPGRARGYKIGDRNSLRNASYLDMTIPYAAGGLYSTVKDLLLWERAIVNKTLISAASTKLMFTPELDGYAYGWIIKEENGTSVAFHAGGIDGFTTNIERVDSEGLCTIILSNIEAAPVATIANDLRAMSLGIPYEFPKHFAAVEVDPALYDRYAGRYLLGDNFVVTVRREDDTLMAQGHGLTTMQLFPYSDTQYFLVDIYAQVTFCFDSHGNVTNFILHQHGNDSHARKLRDDEFTDN